MEGGRRVGHAHSQIRGQFLVECARTETEGYETIERDDAECVKGRLYGSQGDA